MYCLVKITSVVFLLCTELKRLLKFSTGAEEHPPCGVILLESSCDNELVSMHLPAYARLSSTVYVVFRV